MPFSPTQIARDPGYEVPFSALTQTIFFGERGSQSFKGSALFDLAATYSIPVYRSARPWIKVEVLNVTNMDKLVRWDITVSPDASSPRDANGLPTGYIKGQNFGTATATSNFQGWRAGSTGGRTYLLSAGFRF